MAWDKYTVALASSGGVDQPDALYHTVQAALNAAHTTDSHDGAHPAAVPIHAGRYTEDLTLYPGITLVALGEVVIVGAHTVDAGAGTFAARGVRFENVPNASAALITAAGASAQAPQTLLLEDCDFVNTEAAQGVAVQAGPTTVILRRCRITVGGSDAFANYALAGPVLIEDSVLDGGGETPVSPAMDLGGPSAFELRRCILRGPINWDTGGVNDAVATLRETHVTSLGVPCLNVANGDPDHLATVTIVHGSLDAQALPNQTNVWANGCHTRHAGVALLGAASRGTSGTDTPLLVI